MREFTLGVDHVEDDDGVFQHLDENDVRQLGHHQFAGSGDAVAFADPFRIRRREQHPQPNRLINKEFLGVSSPRRPLFWTQKSKSVNVTDQISPPRAGDGCQ